MATKLVVDCTTGETQEVELTAEELAAIEEVNVALEAEKAALKAEEQALKEAKESALAKLTALGLTENEIKAIAR